MLVEDNLFNMKSLTEEQKRMRELMGFTYKDNSHDILAEQNIKVIREEHGGRFNKEYAMKKDLDKKLNNITYAKDNCISPKETAKKLQSTLNLLLKKSIDNVLKKIPVTLGADGVTIVNKTIPWNVEEEDIAFSLPLKLKYLLNEIFNDPIMGKCYKILYDSFPVISNQLDSDEVDLIYEYLRFNYPENFTKRAKGRKTTKQRCKQGNLMVKEEDLNLLRTDRPFCIKEKGSYYKFEKASAVPLLKIQLAGAEVDFNGYLPDTWIPVDEKECECEDLTTGEMIKYPCDGPKPPECIEDITPIELKLDLVDAFAFDKVEDTDGTSWWHKDDGGKQFDDFIELYNETKEENSMVWDQYLEFLKDKGVIIYGYASRDDDPDKDMIGDYIKCNKDEKLGGTKQARRDYNQCLSEKRAEQVIKDIVALLPELDGVFTGVGKGESCKSGNCWKSGKAVNTDLTKEDRRVTGTFPTFKTTIKN